MARFIAVEEIAVEEIAVEVEWVEGA